MLKTRNSYIKIHQNLSKIDQFLTIDVLEPIFDQNFSWKKMKNWLSWLLHLFFMLQVQIRQTGSPLSCIFSSTTNRFIGQISIIIFQINQTFKAVSWILEPWSTFAKWSCRIFSSISATPAEVIPHHFRTLN